MMTIRVLFLTRKYPPQTGGMERYSFELYRSLPCEKRLIAIAQRSRLSIIWITPLLFFRGLIAARGVDCIFLADGVLAPVGRLLRALTGRPVVCAVHGLEFTYRFPLYSLLVRTALRQLDRIIVVSENTRTLALEAGISPERCVVISNGVAIPEPTLPPGRRDLDALLRRSTAGRFVLCSIGRLVERKGIDWFLTKVVESLDDRFLYCIAGTGPELNRIRAHLQRSNIEKKVIILGWVSEADKAILLRTTDCFVMPNISTLGDVEGFGIAALEAAAYGRPVVASRLEGITEAIHDGQNGLLVEPGNGAAFRQSILRLSNDPAYCQTLGQNARRYTRERFDWATVGRQYVREFSDAVSMAKGSARIS